MKAIKSFGNNAVLCIDNNGHEVVVLGLGVGYPKCPYDLTDLSKIDKTFYGVEKNQYNLLEDIDYNLFKFCSDIIDLSTTILNTPLKPNAAFTLADHISFAISRQKKNIDFMFPVSNELKDMYPNEVKIAIYAIKSLNKKLHIILPETEMYGIMMNIINSEENSSAGIDYANTSMIIDDIVIIVEKELKIKIDRNSFNYSRFVSHIQYLLKRIEKNSIMNTDNKKIFEVLRDEYSQTYKCAVKIRKYLTTSLNRIINDEELLYLILHINRLYSREGCNSKMA